MDDDSAGRLATDGILDALVQQKDALLAEITASADYDKKRSDQLDNLLRSIERALAVANTLKQREGDTSNATRAEMNTALGAINARIQSLADHRLATRLEAVAEKLCASCADILRGDDHAAGATATS